MEHVGVVVCVLGFVAVIASVTLAVVQHFSVPFIVTIYRPDGSVHKKLVVDALSPSGATSIARGILGIPSSAFSPGTTWHIEAEMK
jgi:hypothetical protein